MLRAQRLPIFARLSIFERPDVRQGDCLLSCKGMICGKYSDIMVMSSASSINYTRSNCGY
jgi:hypothetical protein